MKPISSSWPCASHPAPNMDTISAVNAARTSRLVCRRHMHHARPIAGKPSRSHMLVDKDRVPVRVHDDEAGWPRRRLVRLLMQLHSLGLELALQVADVRKRGQSPGIAIPAGIEG